MRNMKRSETTLQKEWFSYKSADRKPFLAISDEGKKTDQHVEAVTAAEKSVSFQERGLH